MLAPGKTLSAQFDPFSVSRHHYAVSTLQRSRLLSVKTSRAKARRRHRFRSHAAAVVVAAAVACSSSTSSPTPSVSSPWLCPSCSAPLSFSSSSDSRKSLTCPRGHCYDVAREGYVNLARAGRKAKKRGNAAPAGDAPESLAARARFLGAGHFDGVMDAAADAVIEVLEGQDGEETKVVLDAGCGEGSYLRHLARRLSSLSSSSSSPSSFSPSSTIQLLGVDVAKAAVRSASSRARRESSSPSLSRPPHFAVASAFDLPLRDASVACALVAFAPLPSAELRRVLIDGGDAGSVVVVGPGPDHFFGLKKAVYGEDRARRKGSEEGEEGGGEGGAGGDEAAATQTTRRERRRRISYNLDLDGPAALDLLTMTPYFWRASEETRERLAREGLETEVDVFVDTVVVEI